ncbi:head-tail connector protein [Variovorax boronicumulans]|uniref:head-tail connector protein n=1 Tax=Variovorax boronicumulans TaxID=436515 RepID=UPI001C569A60
MALIELPAAKAHLRLDDDYPDDQVQPYLDAAELSASTFLNRAVFATQGELDEAVAAVPAALIAAGEVYDAAMLVANEIGNPVARCAARDFACRVYTEAQAKALETRCGIVVNSMIQAGILLILGHLFENRQENVVGTIVAELKLGAQHLLFPYRIGLGV